MCSKTPRIMGTSLATAAKAFDGRRIRTCPRRLALCAPCTPLYGALRAAVLTSSARTAGMGGFHAKDVSSAAQTCQLMNLGGSGAPAFASRDSRRCYRHNAKARARVHRYEAAYLGYSLRSVRACTLRKPSTTSQCPPHRRSPLATLSATRSNV